MSKDQYVIVKVEGNKVSYCAITVDDSFFAITRDEEWINGTINMLKVERGEDVNILGMTVHLERTKGRVVINQKRFVDNLITTYGVTMTAITPATGDLMYAPEDSKLLDDQRKFMSLNATLTLRNEPIRRYLLRWYI